MKLYLYYDDGYERVVFSTESPTVDASGELYTSNESQFGELWGHSLLNLLGLDTETITDIKQNALILSINLSMSAVKRGACLSVFVPEDKKVTLVDIVKKPKKIRKKK